MPVSRASGYSPVTDSPTRSPAESLLGYAIRRANTIENVVLPVEFITAPVKTAGGDILMGTQGKIMGGIGYILPFQGSRLKALADGGILKSA
jgi:hypothetical protein